MLSRRPWSSLRRARRPIAPALRDELAQPPAWMFPWDFGDGVEAPLLGEHLRAVHETRMSMIEPVVRAVLASAGPRATAIDLACNEGWFSHRLLDWGAARVVGVDIRPRLIHRAELVRDHFGISSEQLELRCADALTLSPTTLAPADVVLAFGIVYHVEAPMRLLRAVRALTRRLCLVESQLARDEGPVHFGWGQNAAPGVPVWETPALLGAFFENDQDTNPLAAAGHGLSFVPNAAALTLMMQAAGFPEVETLPAGESADYQYQCRDRVIMAGRPRDES